MSPHYLTWPNLALGEMPLRCVWRKRNTLLSADRFAANALGIPERKVLSLPRRTIADPGFTHLVVFVFASMQCLNALRYDATVFLADGSPGSRALRLHVRVSGSPVLPPLQ